MLKEFIGSKRLTFVLLAILIAAGLFGWSAVQSRASAVSNIMYLIPEDSSLIEANITPNALNEVDTQEVGFSYVNEVGATSDWKVIEDLVIKGELDALIIHHAAEEVVDWTALKAWFQNNGLIVAGIGLPGDELARSLGAPGLYIRQGAEEMNFDYFIYYVQVSGQPEDVKRIEDAGFTSEALDDIKAPLSVGRSASRGFLFGESGDVAKFLGSIDGQLIQLALDKES